MKLFQFLILSICSFSFATTKSPISYEDIVKFSKPQILKLSPDGSKLAYVVQSGDIERNTPIDTVYSYDLQTHIHSMILKAPSLIQLEWDPQTQSIYTLSKEEGHYQITRHSSSNHTLIVDSERPIIAFQIAPSSKSLIYTKTKYDSDDIVQYRIDNGFVYQWKEDNVLTLSKGSYRKKQCEEIYLIDLSTNATEKVTEIPYTHWTADFDNMFPVIPKIAISPSNQYFAFELVRRGQVELGELPFSCDVIIWDNASHHFIHPPGKNSLGTKTNPCWISDQTLVFQLNSTEGEGCQLYTFDCITQKEALLKFSTHFPAFDNIVLSHENQLIGLTSTQAVIISIPESTCTTIQFPEAILPKAYWITPSLDNSAKTLATVHESSNVAPEILVYDFQTGEHLTVSHLNPWINQKELGFVEELSFTTKNNVQSTGYLVHPINEQPNTQYPLIIGTYGFSGGFILDAEWHTTFPSQVLANEGYFVLLLNDAPGCSQNLVGNPIEAMKIEGWDMLELFETAVDQLVEKRIVDPCKIGIYGWSHGGFIVNFLISHSSKFQVACYGEGADYNPSEYWVGGNEAWAKIFDNTFGGPPW